MCMFQNPVVEHPLLTIDNVKISLQEQRSNLRVRNWLWGCKQVLWKETMWNREVMEMAQLSASGATQYWIFKKFLSNSHL